MAPWPLFFSRFSHKALGVSVRMKHKRTGAGLGVAFFKLRNFHFLGRYSCLVE